MTMPMRLNIPPLLRLWHRWFGLLAGIWLILLAVSGSIIVFYDELDTALNRDLWITQGEGEPLSPGSMTARIEAAHPGGYVQIMNLPDGPRDTAAAILAPRGEGPDAVAPGTQVFIDPYSGEILGERVFGTLSLGRRHIMGLIYELHMDALLGHWMMWVLGLVALLWIIDHAVSLWLSVRAAKHWTRIFTVRKSPRVAKQIFDWHRALGVWLVPVTLMLAVSGLYFNWYDSFVRVVGLASPLTESPLEHRERLDPPAWTPPVSVDAAIAAALPDGDARIDLFRQFPASGAYLFRVFDDRDMDGYGRRQIFVDALTGAVLSDRHQGEGTAGDVFVAWQYPLHSGRAFGWPGRILIFLSGWVVTALTVTGLVLWARRSLGRKPGGR